MGTSGASLPCSVYTAGAVSTAALATSRLLFPALDDSAGFYDDPLLVQVVLSRSEERGLPLSASIPLRSPQLGSALDSSLALPRGHYRYN